MDGNGDEEGRAVAAIVERRRARRHTRPPPQVFASSLLLLLDGFITASCGGQNVLSAALCSDAQLPAAVAGC